MNFAFAGTPGFSSWVLLNLVERGFRPSLVLTQPDSRQGRGRKVLPPPAATQARGLGLECVQTPDVNEAGLLRRLLDTGIDTLVVASFGQILRSPLLEAVLCVNLHSSLLPKYRGAAPIQRAIAGGEPETGVSIMRITERLDEGPVALQKALPLNLHDDAGSVSHALGVLGAIALGQVLEGLEDGTVEWREQGSGGSYAKKVRTGDCLFDSSLGAKELHDRVRSMSPATGLRASSGSVAFKILRTWPYGQAGLKEVPAEAQSVAGVPGVLLETSERLFVGCREGAVELLVIQPTGKERMPASCFMRGYRSRLGERIDKRLTAAESCEGGAEEV